jgi:hypothetical protein
MLAGLTVLVGCGPSAEVTGTAGGVDFGSIAEVYFGGPFLVLSVNAVDCTDVSFVEKTYDQGEAPTEQDVAILQFAWDGDTLQTGKLSVGRPGDAVVWATVVHVKDGLFEETNSESGEMSLSSFDEEGTADGTFSEVTFEDGGVLSGEFHADWCRNLRAD